MFEYDKYAAEAVEILDRYDFTADVEECLKKDIRDCYIVREYLEERHGTMVAAAFDRFSLTEFRIYMTIRYNVCWSEERSYRMWRPKNPETACYFKGN